VDIQDVLFKALVWAFGSHLSSDPYEPHLRTVRDIDIPLQM